MRRIAALSLVLLAVGLPVRADDDLRPVAQVPLLPLADGPHEDIDALVRTFWHPYFETTDENAFGRANLRAGRLDLDGDGEAELVLMIDAPGWEADKGNPFVIAKWTRKHWNAVGWGNGDEDTVFATTEVRGGWRSVDSGTQVLRWAGKEYRAEDKPETTLR